MHKNNLSLADFIHTNYTNDIFEGFCVDLLEELSRALKFTYKIKPILGSRYDDMVDEVRTKVNPKKDIFFDSIDFFFVITSRELI